jgi:hypothetical protein
VEKVDEFSITAAWSNGVLTDERIDNVKAIAFARKQIMENDELAESRERYRHRDLFSLI